MPKPQASWPTRGASAMVPRHDAAGYPPHVAAPAANPRLSGVASDPSYPRAPTDFPGSAVASRPRAVPVMPAPGAPAQGYPPTASPGYPPTAAPGYPSTPAAPGYPPTAAPGYPPTASPGAAMANVAAGVPGRPPTAPMPPAALYPETAQLPPLAGGAGYPVAPGDPHMRAMPTAGVLPGTPTPIPITPRPGFIAFGIVCMAMAMWSLFDFLPGVAPGAKASARLGELGEGLYYGANVAAVLLLIIGFVVTLGATIYRAQTEVLCRVCNHQVIGWKDPFGLRCPLEPHYARVSWLTLAITGTFWTVGVAALILLAVAIWT